MEKEKGGKMKELDLHGVDWENAPYQCHKFINENWGREMKIITGHSTTMKKIVVRIAKNYDLSFRVGGITGTLPYVTIQKERPYEAKR